MLPSLLLHAGSSDTDYTALYPRRCVTLTGERLSFETFGCGLFGGPITPRTDLLNHKQERRKLGSCPLRRVYTAFYCLYSTKIRDRHGYVRDPECGGLGRVEVNRTCSNFAPSASKPVCVWKYIAATASLFIDTDCTARVL
jgi:hypothetical protein